jgi:hypothetical protein
LAEGCCKVNFASAGVTGCLVNNKKGFPFVWTKLHVIIRVYGKLSNKMGELMVNESEMAIYPMIKATGGD